MSEIRHSYLCVKAEKTLLRIGINCLPPPITVTKVDSMSTHTEEEFGQYSPTRTTKLPVNQSQ